MANLNEKEQLIDLERLFKEEQYEDALALAEKLKKEFTASFRIDLLYAKILRVSKELEKAEAVLNNMLASYPDNLNVLLEAAALSVDLNKLEQAREYYNKILFIDSFNAQAKAALEKLDQDSDEPTLEVKPPPAENKGPDTKKKPWRDDTLAEEELNRLEDLVSGNEPEGDDVEITEESIRVEEDAVHIPVKPTIPGVDEAFVKEPAEDIDEVSTESVEDFFMEARDESRANVHSTEKAPAPRTGNDSGSPESELEGEDFITESAAELYMSQGLYEEALFVYEKLYITKKDEKYVEIIDDLKVKSIGQKKIQALTAFLELIQRRSE